MPVVSYFSSGGSTEGHGVELAPVSNISTLTSSGKVYIKWTDPEDIVLADIQFATWEGTILVRKVGSAPMSRTDGVVVLDSKTRNKYQNSYFCDSELSDGVTYYYKFYSYTTRGTYTDATENEFSAKPEAIQVGNVSAISAVNNGNGKLAIKWTDPAEHIVSDGVTLTSWKSTKVVYKTGSYPTSPDDGILAINSTTRNAYATNPLIVSGLTDGTTYYFSFFPISTDGAINSNTANRITGVSNRFTISTVPSQSGTLTYTGNALSPTWSGYDSNIMTIGGVTSGINAGTYTAIFTPKDDYKWNDGSFVAKSVEWKIDKASGSLSVNPTSLTLNNGNLTGVISVTRSGDGSITAESSNTNIAIVSVSGTNITVSHVGKAHGTATVTVKVAAGTNHTAPSNKTVTITANFPKVSTGPSQSGTLTYTGSSQSPTWSSYDYNQLTLGGVTSGTDANSYVATFTPKGDYSWSDGSMGSKNVTWTIGKASIAKAPSQKEALTYNGSSQSPSWNDYSEEQLILSGVTNGTNAGSYSATFTPTSNYQWSDGSVGAKNSTWSIGKATGSLSISPTSMTLNSGITSGTITVTKVGDGAVTAKSSDESVATVSVSTDGNTVTVSSVNSTTGEATITVSVASGTNHTAPSDATCVVTAQFLPVSGNALNDYTWNEISQVSSAGLAANYWAVGDRKGVNLNGTVGSLSLSGTYYCYIIGIDHNAAIEGANRIHFQFGYTDLSEGKAIAFCDGGYNSTRSSGAWFNMYNTGSNIGGWENSLMRTVICPAFKNAMPADLQAVIKTVTKYTDNVGGRSTTADRVTATTEEIFIPSAFEFSGASYNSNPAEANYQARYQWYADGNSTYRFRHDNLSTICIYWTRSVEKNTTYYFMRILNNNNGVPSGTGTPNCSYGFAPCFCV